VESFGFGAPRADLLPNSQEAVKNCQEAVKNGQTVSVTPASFISLPVAMGSSSSAVVSAVDTDSTHVGDFLGGTTIPIWSAANVKDGYQGETNVVDGNATDNSAVTALLRRGVCRIIANCSGGVDILDTDNFLKNIHWLPDLFKDVEGCKVFEESKWDDLYDALTERAREKKPCVHEQTLEVLENKRLGVKGGWKVDIIWMYPNRSEAFEKACPPSTQALFQQKAVATFVQSENVSKTFPYVRTDLGNFDADLLQLLAENAAWQMLEGVGEKRLRHFFR